MDDKALSAIIKDPPAGVLKVSMSKDGIFFTAGTETHEITDDQADLLWRMLPLMAQLRMATKREAAQSAE